MVKNPPAMQETRQELQVQSLGQEDSLQKRNGSPLQYSCLGNPMHREAWRATVHGVAKELDKIATKQPQGAHIPPSCASLPLLLSHPFRSLQRAKLSSLCNTATFHQPSSSHMVMYVFQCHSLNLSHPLVPWKFFFFNHCY